MLALCTTLVRYRLLAISAVHNTFVHSLLDIRYIYIYIYNIFVHGLLDTRAVYHICVYGLLDTSIVYNNICTFYLILALCTIHLFSILDISTVYNIFIQCT